MPAPAARIIAAAAVACAWTWVAPAPAAAVKTLHAPGYRLVQLTDDDQKDRLPRVSHGAQAPLLTWLANKQVPSAASANGDYEVFLWDAYSLEQITDDDVDDNRPVVNVHREMAWQKWGNTEWSEICERFFDPGVGWRNVRVTNDTLNDRRDRYPDINDQGLVVWGRSIGGNGWLLTTHQVGSALPYQQLPNSAYRPQTNNLGHVSAGSFLWEADGTLIQQLSGPDYGYDVLGRSELNGLDQLMFEAKPDETSGSQEGPRDVLFWDGSEMSLIHTSPVWAGRGDLNDSGVVVFEGYGGLPGTSSGEDDREIFVYETSTDTLVQLTDDEIADEWVRVTDDGTIVWQAEGGVADAISGEGDTEIMLALPLAGDFDGDGASNDVDVCPVTHDPGQADSDGDGVGDACSGTCSGFRGVADCSAVQVAIDGCTDPAYPPASGGRCGQGGGAALVLLPVFAVRARRRGVRRQS